MNLAVLYVQFEERKLNFDALTTCPICNAWILSVNRLVLATLSSTDPLAAVAPAFSCTRSSPLLSPKNMIELP